MDKQIRDLRFLGILSVIAWVVTTFAIIAIWYFKGDGGFGLPIPSDKSVSPRTYANSFQTIEVLVFSVIPSFASGYLLLGLLVLRASQKLKKFAKESS